MDGEIEELEKSLDKSLETIQRLKGGLSGEGALTAASVEGATYLATPLHVAASQGRVQASLCSLDSSPTVTLRIP